MKTNKSIIGFFKSKCIKNEISFLIEKKGIKLLNLNNIEDLRDNNEQTSLLIIDVTSKKEMSKFEKILKKHSHYVIFIMREDDIKSNLLGNLQFIYPPIKPFDFVEQVEKFFNSIERVRQRKKIGEFILTSSELISDRKKGKIRLTTLESKFLNFLYTNKEGLTKKELLECVWDYNAKVETHTLESLVYRLRRKLESDPNSPKILVQTGNKYILKS
jgi:DNA-binding response OmpR family regulator